MTSKEQRWIELINNGEFKLKKKQAESAYDAYHDSRYLNNTTEEVDYSDISDLFIYFIKNTPFDLDVYINFIKKIDAVYLSEFRESQVMDIFYKEVMLPNYFDRKYTYRGTVKPNLNLSVIDKEKLKVFMYCILCEVKNKYYYYNHVYLDYCKQIDQNLYQELVSSSHEKLEIEVIETSNEYFQATSNNILSTIKIIAFESKQENYKAILDYINQLFEQGFPKSHTLEFEVKGLADQKELGITNLLDCGGNRFFNSAAKFPDLHKDILRYIKIVGYEACYTDIAENKNFKFYEIGGGETQYRVAAFAIYAILLEDFQHINLFIGFIEQLDCYEDCEQCSVPKSLLARHGVTNESIRAYLLLCDFLVGTEVFGYDGPDEPIYFTTEASKKILDEEIAKCKQENSAFDSGGVLECCVFPSCVNTRF